MALASLVSFQEQKLHYFARRHSLKLAFEHSNKKQKRFFQGRDERIFEVRS